MTLTETAALSQEQDSNNITVREKNRKMQFNEHKIMLYVKEGQGNFFQNEKYKAQRWHQRLYSAWTCDRPARVCRNTPSKHFLPAITGPAHSSEV